MAAELWAMCDEFWPPDQLGMAERDIEKIAEHVLRVPIWSMWLG